MQGSIIFSILLISNSKNLISFISAASCRVFNWNKSSKILLLETPFSNLEETLLLIDIQTDYFPGGKMELVDMKEVVKRQHNLLKHFVLQTS